MNDCRITDTVSAVISTCRMQDAWLWIVIAANAVINTMVFYHSIILGFIFTINFLPLFSFMSHYASHSLDSHYSAWQVTQITLKCLPLKVTKPEPSPHVCGHSWSCWRRDKLTGNFLESPVSKVNQNIYLQQIYNNKFFAGMKDSHHNSMELLLQEPRNENKHYVLCKHGGFKN